MMTFFHTPKKIKTRDWVIRFIAFDILFLRIFQVHKKLTSSGSRGVLYETELLEQFADTDAAKEFFARLDLQLNKVNQFYKGKEKEFLERGGSLKKQMEILLELKAALKKQRGWASSTNDAKDDPSISCSITCGTNSIFLLQGIWSLKRKLLVRMHKQSTDSNIRGGLHKFQ